MQVTVRYNDYVGTHQLYVVHGDGPSLLGRDWLSKIQLDWASIRAVQEGVPAVNKLVQKYSEVFHSGAGTMLKHTAQLSLKPGVTPRFCRPRAVPFAIKERVGKELNHLEESGVLRRVEHAEWEAPIVLVPKRDGSIRICGDYKVTINPHLNVDQYPLPKPADLMASLTGGKHFSKLDLHAAYQQMRLDS